MSSMNKASSLLAQRYANALVDAAEGAGALAKVEKDIADLQAMVEACDDLVAVIRSPLLPQDKMLGVVDALADKAKFNVVTKNFLGVLVQNRRLGVLEAIMDGFNGELSARRGEVRVDVQVAQDISAKQKKALEDVLSKAIGKDVAVNARVEPSILGGMIVTVGSQMIDNSVARKLARLRLAMGLQANENNLSNISEVS